MLTWDRSGLQDYEFEYEEDDGEDGNEAVDVENEYYMAKG